MHPTPPLTTSASNRLSTQSLSSSASDSSSSSSYRPLSSSSNGRLTPTSQRLSVVVPDNGRFIPTLVAAHASGGEGNRPASSLSRSWSAAEEEDDDEEGRAHVWVGEGERRDEEEEDPRGGTGNQPGRGVGDSSAPSTPISLPPVEFDAAGPQQHDPASYSDRSSLTGHEGPAGEGLGIVGLQVGGSSSFSRRDADGIGMRSHQHQEEEGEAGRLGWKVGEGGEQVEMTFPPLSTDLPPSHEVPTYEAATSLPPSHPPLHGSSPSETSALSRPSLVSHASGVSSIRSLRPSTSSIAASSNSSTLSLPTVPPVDLNLPNVRPGGTYVSVADSRMASLAANNAPVNRSNNHSSGARSFFSNLLNRSPRANSTSPRHSPSPSSSPTTSPNPSAPPRSPSAPLGWQHYHPSVASLQSAAMSAPHLRSTSMPTITGHVGSVSPSPRESSDLYRPTAQDVSSGEAPQRRTPRAIAAATFAGLTRSSSLGGVRAGSPRLGGSPTGLPFASAASSSRPPSRPLIGASPVPTIGFATPPLPSSSSNAPPPLPPTLQSIGLKNLPLTPEMGLSRNGQPLCGAVLDNKYLLIGTTIGLDFLPLPLPGSLPMKHHGSRKRKETRKPIPLIKRTRFKELAILAERSNILLAIAGRNDHIRVYALDGIRSMIEKKMHELNLRDGYPVVQDASIFEVQPGHKAASSAKGKGRAVPSSREGSSSSSGSSSRPISTFPPSSSAHLEPCPSYQFPPAARNTATATGPPSDYMHSANSPRRRPPSWHQASLASPSSPIRISSRTVHTPSNASFVRAVPTNPSTPTTSAFSPSGAPRGSVSSMTTVTPGTPRNLRGQKSREFIAGRKGSTATIGNSVGKRRSRADLQTPPLPGSRRSSVASVSGASGTRRRGSSRRSSTRGGEEDDSVDADSEHLAVPPLPSTSSSGTLTARRPPAISDSGGWFTETGGYSPIPRPRSRMEPRPPIKPQNPLERSPTSDLAEFLRDSGPEMRSPEMDNVLAISRGRRRSSITDNLLQAAKEAHLFPAAAGGTGRKTPARPGFPRSVTTSHVAGLALYTDNGDGRKDELVEMLHESAAEVARAEERRRASMNDFRPSHGLSSGIDARSASLTQREARSPLLESRERSPAPDLAEVVVRETGTTATYPSPRHSPRAAATPRLEAGQKSPSVELAALLQETGPQDYASLSNTVAPSSTTGFGNSDAPLPPSSSPGTRASKRWTMSGVVGSKLLSRPRSSSSASIPALPATSPLHDRPASSASGRINSNGTVLPPQPRISQDSRSSNNSSPWEMVNDPMERAAASLAPPPPTMRQPSAVPSSDFKRRPATSLHRSEAPSLPASSQIPPDAHPANSASPLEYVKLARTKGARLLRAVETKKRTYLAVLCGEDGERIELFTGSRSISLSLNRTFVLPETPRTVEFQLQGDDLVDIYLVYSESIFALEPATVRVREVGVGRGERRARRERERRLRDLAATSRGPVAEGAPSAGVRSPSLHSALHPADHALQEPPMVSDDSQAEGEDPLQQVVHPAVSLAERPRTMSTSVRSPENPPPAFSSGEFPVPPASAAPSAASSHGTTSIEDVPGSGRSSKSSAPYSTFQQLSFVPPVPSSVLSSAWTIPPLYTDVVAGSPAPPADAAFDDELIQPAITVTGSNGIVSEGADEIAANMAAAAAAADGTDLPLLSPISLLGGAASRQNGPPGLFFVSKGRNLSGIVTADGKSIIKRPLVWSHDRQVPTDLTTDIRQRVEVLVVGGKRTVVVKLSPLDVKCISVDGLSSTSPFSPALTISPMHSRPSIQFLATHSPSQQLLYAQTVASSYTIQCLAAAS
ncbi:hypothetical protein JCM11251_002223 [Rhodosporidiobolus azoricus]